MRPDSIRWFDRLFLLGMALELALSIWRIRQALHVTNSANTPFFVGMAAISFLMIGAFWFAISRLASTIAKWAWTILLIIIPLGFAATASRSGLAFHAPLNLEYIAFNIVRPLLYGSATLLLFRPDAKAWFADRGRKSRPG